MDERIKQRVVDALLSKPLVINAFRGTLVEAIIAEALEPEWGWLADGWGSFDFEGPDGIGLEVKQSAARQSWHDESSRECRGSFDIRERLGFYAGDTRWVDAPGRQAAIYIFAHHPIFDAAIADHRDPEQWDFYVVPAAKLPAAQKTIALSRVRGLTEPVRFRKLLEAVNKCRDGIRVAVPH